jgi:hypothetical protein
MNPSANYTVCRDSFLHKCLLGRERNWVGVRRKPLTNLHNCGIASLQPAPSYYPRLDQAFLKPYWSNLLKCPPARRLCIMEIMHETYISPPVCFSLSPCRRTAWWLNEKGGGKKVDKQRFGFVFLSFAMLSEGMS